VANQPVVWQARIGTAAVVDTVLVTADGPRPVTPPDLALWPYKRIKLKERSFDVPDVLVKEG
jgi:Xaa-Pro dipeptidase